MIFPPPTLLNFHTALKFALGVYLTRLSQEAVSIIKAN